MFSTDGGGELEDLLTKVSDRIIDADGILSADFADGGREILPGSVSNVPDLLIVLVTGVLSISGGAGLSIGFSNVSDRGMDAEKLSLLVGVVDFIEVIFGSSGVELLSFVGSTLLQKSIQ